MLQKPSSYAAGGKNCLMFRYRKLTEPPLSGAWRHVSRKHEVTEAMKATLLEWLWWRQAKSPVPCLIHGTLKFWQKAAKIRTFVNLLSFVGIGQTVKFLYLFQQVGFYMATLNGQTRTPRKRAPFYPPVTDSTDTVMWCQRRVTQVSVLSRLTSFQPLVVCLFLGFW